MHNISYLTLDTEHAEQMSLVHNQSFNNNWNKDFFATMIHNQCNAIGAFEHHTQQMVGFILYSIIQDEAEIITFCVLYDYRNKNIGQYLLQSLLADNQIQHVFLEVNSHNKAARHIYHKLGFEQINIRKTTTPLTNNQKMQ